MSDINKHWQRWIMSSVYDHFKKGCVPIKMHIDGEDPISAENFNKIDSFEFKHLGPDFDPKPSREYEVHLGVNIMVVSTFDPKEPFKHLNNVGLAQSLFTPCLTVYKYGPYRDVDDKSYLTRLELIAGVKTTAFGNLDPVTRVTRTTVEGHYFTVIEGVE